MVKIIIGFFAVACLWSCSKTIQNSTIKTVSDSTYTLMKPTQVPIVLPSKIVFLDHQVPCDQATNKAKPFDVKSKSNGLQAEAKINDAGVLEVKCTEDSLKELITVMDKEIFHLRHETESNTRTVIQYRIPKIYTYSLIFSILVIVCMAGYVYFKFIKPW